jgi:hypothetical protein
MSFPTASGHPNMSGGYIPILFATKLLIAFYTATVLGSIATTEYEGQVSEQGDTLRIRTLPDIEIKNYVKGQKLTYTNLNGSWLDLLIDKGKYWSFPVNDVDKLQSDIDFAKKWAEHASIGLKVAVDGDVLGNVYADVHPANKGNAAGVISGGINLGVSGTPVTLNKSTIIDWIVQAGVVLDEQNVPEENRYMVLPSWACGLIKLSDLKDASMTGDGQSILRNGRIGMIDRFEIFRSNNLSTVTDTVKVTNAIFGHKVAIAFASQMIKQEMLKNPDDFGELIRALQVYGYKVVKPEALGHGYIKQGT